MRRRLFKLTTFLWLALMVATLALWMRSYWRTDELTLTYRGDGAEQLRSRRGTIAFIHTLTRPNANRDAFGEIKFTTDPDQSGYDGVFVLSDSGTRHAWHGFSYDTLDEWGIRLAVANRAVSLSALATIDDYIETMSKPEGATKDPKVQAQLARMQVYKLRSQSILTSIGPISNAPQ